MSTAAVEPFSLEHLDEDWAIPCVVKKPWGCGGENAAEWIARFVPCCRPRTTFYCTSCKDMLVNWRDGIWCEASLTMHLPSSTAFASIEPLNL